MSYSWIGAPAEFNGTNEATGGDSGEISNKFPPVHFSRSLLLRSLRSAGDDAAESTCQHRLENFRDLKIATTLLSTFTM